MMFGLVVMEGMTMSGHLSNIDEMVYYHNQRRNEQLEDNIKISTDGIQYEKILFVNDLDSSDPTILYCYTIILTQKLHIMFSYTDTESNSS